MPEWIADVRYAARMLLKSPVFAAVAVLSLALGIGANTAIFTFLDQVLLRLLPVKNPQELVQLTWRGNWYGSNTGFNALSYPLYRDFRDNNQVFTDIFCRRAIPLSVGYEGQTERLRGELVSGNYFQALGVGAAAGRVLTPDDDRTPGAHPVVVLSYQHWMSAFEGRAGVIGKPIVINSHTFTIVGVSEKGFDGVDIGDLPKIRIPAAMVKEITPGWADLYNLENRRARWVNVFCRLKPGVSRMQAQASLQPFFHSLLESDVRSEAFSRATQYTKDQYLKSWIEAMPGAQGRPGLRQQLSTPLWILMVIVGLVLLIACANVANMLLARATTRYREFALRLALGAGRARIVRQLMVESVLLASLGGVFGMFVSVWTSRALARFIPEEVNLKVLGVPDLRVFLFAVGVSLATALFFGLLPALRATRIALSPALKEEAGSIAGGGRARLRKSLVIAQVFLSLLLLIGAGLFIRSLANLRNLDPGFRTSNLIAFSIDPMLSGYSKERTAQFYRQLSEQLNAAPGADSASVAVVRVLDGDEWDNSVAVEGYEPKPGEDMNPYYNAVSPAYFATLGIPLLAGRDFNWNDASGGHKVGVVNEKFAKHYFKDGRALGRHFGFGGDPGTKTDIEIVGVIKDAKYLNMRDEIPRQVLIPFQQARGSVAMTAYVRTRQDPNQMFRSIRETVRRLDANLPVYSMRTMETQQDHSLVLERFVATLASAFSLLATLLAAIGLYGVTAYSVARRTREIGVRMALGARAGDVGRMVLLEVMRLVSIGVLLAVPATLAVARLVESQLFGVSPTDARTILVATAALVAVALSAGYFPARRATQVDPMQALRYE